MLSATTLILLRLLHITLGVFWVGTMIFMAVFLIPSVRAVGPVGGQIMQQLMGVRRLSTYIVIAAVITVATGVTLYWSASLAFKTEWPDSGPGVWFGRGGMLGIAALIIGMTIINPGGRKILRLGAAMRASGGTPTPEQAAEMDRLQRRVAIATRTVAVLVVLATMCMASARYVP